MSKSTTELDALLQPLTAEARRLGFTDTAWAARAGVRKETLSRLRSRRTCDLATLSALAAAVDSRVAMRVGSMPDGAPGAFFPAGVDRESEERLADLCANGDTDPVRWASLGPAFFMAGLAVMLASSPGVDRRSLLELAEQLHVGVTEPAVFARWLERSPVRPSRFLPLVEARSRERQRLHAR